MKQQEKAAKPKKRKVGRPQKKEGKLSTEEMAVCNRFAKVLKDKNLTQSEAAEHMNIRQNAISRIVIGANAPSLGMVIRIINTFEINPTWFLLGKGRPYQGGSTGTIKNEVADLAEKIKNLSETLYILSK